VASIVLGLGTSHTPMLNVKRDEWQRFAESDPTITRLRDKAGELKTYEELAAPCRACGGVNDKRILARRTLRTIAQAWSRSNLLSEFCPARA